MPGGPASDVQGLTSANEQAPPRVAESLQAFREALRHYVLQVVAHVRARDPDSQERAHITHAAGHLAITPPLERRKYGHARGSGRWARLTRPRPRPAARRGRATPRPARPRDSRARSGVVISRVRGGNTRT